MRIYLRVAAVACCTVVSLGCRGYSITGGPGRTSPPSLQTGAADAAALVSINSLYIPKVLVEDRVRLLTDPKVDFDHELAEALHQELDLKLLQYEEGAPSSSSKSDLIAYAGRRGADGILLTRIHNFIERDGTRLASDQPASVDFSMSVHRVSDGAKIWDSSFHFKDQALSENLFKIDKRFSGDREGGWKSARELLIAGYRSALSDFARRRFAQYSAHPR